MLGFLTQSSKFKSSGQRVVEAQIWLETKNIPDVGRSAIPVFVELDKLGDFGVL